MDKLNFSLIYPDEKSREEHLFGDAVPDIDMYTLQELGMTQILDLKSSELCDYFTSDAEVMRYRLETFTDMMNSPALTLMIDKLIPILNDITELRRLEADFDETDDYLSSIT